GDEPLALGHDLLEEVLERFPPGGGDAVDPLLGTPALPGDAALDPPLRLEPLEGVVDGPGGDLDQVLEAVVDLALQVVPRPGLLFDEDQEGEGIDRNKDGRHKPAT